MSREDRLDDILILWEDAAKRGQPLTPEEACRSDPTLLPDFLSLLSKLGPIEVVLNGDAASASPDDLIGRIQAGRFTPLGYHAAGGLGLVFYADDTELKRTVALKYMQTLAFLDPVARQRFLTEAEITGKLEHPGIVPVYGLGHDTDGRPYYAMRFIHGATLGDDIDKLHKIRDEAERNVEFRRLLRSFVSVCQTIAYAHVRGVIHRDIKPANIMLGPYGETLVVDWGLAKRYALPEPDDTVDPGYKPVELTAAPAGQTVYGKAKGSPAFMAPEQAGGEWDRVGPHSDIYSLGATLYVLLTGQKPYTGKSSDEVIQAVKAGHLQRPRRHRSDIPRALEAICLKAMAAQPEARYATAKELAEDVDRWMAGEPVAAYPEPLPMRAKRWVKRHQTMVSTSVGVVFVAAALLTVLGIVLSAKNQELKEVNTDLVHAKNDLTNSNTELRDKKQSLEKAQTDLTKSYQELQAKTESLEKAYKAGQEEFVEADVGFRSVMELVAVHAATHSDAATNEVRDLSVKKYSDYLTNYIQRNQNRPERRLEVAFARLKLGETIVLVGTPLSALTSFATAQADFEQLDRETPNNRSIRFGLACSLGLRGAVLNEEQRFAESTPLLANARDIFEQLSRDPTPIPETRYSSNTAGSYLDSPAIRLADVTLELSVQLRLKRLKSELTGANTKAVTPKDVDQQIVWLRIANRTLVAHKELPATTRVIIQAKSLSLKLQLAELNAAEISSDEVHTLLVQLHEQRDRYRLYDVLQKEVLAAELWLATEARHSKQTGEAQLLLKGVIERTEQVATEAAKGQVPAGLQAVMIVPRAEAWHLRADLAEDRQDLTQARKDRRMAMNILGTLSNENRPDFETVLKAVFLYIRLAASAIRDPIARTDGETCYVAALKLVETLPSTVADADSLSALRVILLGGIASARAALGKPINESLAKVEEAIRQHEQITPGDPFLVYPRVSIIFTRALDQLERRNNTTAALAEVELALKVLNAAIVADPNDLGLKFLRSTAEFMATMVLAAKAEELLKTRRIGDPEPLALVQQAKELMKKQQTYQFEEREQQRIVDHVNKQWKGVPERMQILETHAIMFVRCGEFVRQARALMGR